MATCYRHPDRETGLSCSVCGRPICVDCVTHAPVGLRCPEHSGKAQGVQKVTRTIKRAGYEGTGALVTRALIGLNAIVFLAEIVTAGRGGNLINGASGTVFEKGALYGPAVANGQWWRLVTSTFLHAGLIHIGMNMYVLWLVGSALEQRLGRLRYIALYVVSGLAGSAGALLLTPCSPTLGASGAIFGLFGAALVLERQRNFVFAGSIIPIVVINLIFTFSIAGISVGGHIGGLIGGALVMLAITRFGRANAFYGKPGVVGLVALTAVAVASVGVALYAAHAATCVPVFGPFL